MASVPSASDAQCWEAVLRRDPGADGVFYYGVTTTGVYCRPSCGARRPRRANARFFPSRAAAEQAGFRPCRRCRPDQPKLAERHAAVVAEACRSIATAADPPRLDALAAAAGLSRFHFHRIFTRMTGLTPRAYAAAERAGRLRAELAASTSVTAAIYESGFGSSGRFYAAAPQALGMTPTRFRAGGAGMTIRFAIGQSSLGALLVAATGRGICAIALGDAPDALLRDLQDRFPQAELIGGDRAFEKTVATVIGFLERPALGLDLPLDLRGTVFQQRVWQALQTIPAGTTASYTEIARRIGAPRAVRAVAQACAANAIAVAIPCHRVVRQDGGLAGYRWGIARKRALLAREAG